MVCGPEVMIRSTVRELQDRGVEEQSIHVSLERNMKCGVGLCGHCQLGSHFICRDGPVFPHSRVSEVLAGREI
jgi:NAD(P)H-flavin reductase